MSEHVRIDREFGDGYAQPREYSIACKCGALVWVWQQFYEETDEDPDAAWVRHIKHVLRAGQEDPA